MRPLYDRTYDSVLEFEQAADLRYAEALNLDRRSHKLGAVYLFGYSVEMRVKALYFRNAGFQPQRFITLGDRSAAIASWQVLGLLSQPGAHDILGWAQLAVSARATTAFPQYGAFGIEITGKATDLYLIWRETLRYRSCQPTPKESGAVRAVADWFIASYDRMI